MPNWIAKIVGYFIKNKLNLEDATMNDTKPWYLSKTLWTAAVSALIGIYGAISSVHPLPAVPEWVYTILGAVGLYGLRTADTKIG